MQRGWIVVMWLIAASALTGVLVAALASGQSPGIFLVAAIVTVPTIVTVATQHVLDEEGRLVSRASRWRGRQGAGRGAPTARQQRPRQPKPLKRTMVVESPVARKTPTVEWLGGRVPAPRSDSLGSEREPTDSDASRG